MSGSSASSANASAGAWAAATNESHGKKGGLPPNPAPAIKGFGAERSGNYSQDYLIARAEAQALSNNPWSATAQHPRVSASTLLPANAPLKNSPASAPNAAVRAASPTAGTWQPIGPQPIVSSTYGGFNSGRVRSLAYGAKSGELVLSAADGGVWTSFDQGQSWSTTTDQQPGLATGAVAIDPNNNSVIYAGTGEVDGCIDCSSGDGILKSTDQGQTWTNENPAGLFTGTDMAALVVDPGNSNEVWAATSSGLYESTDAGTTWAQNSSVPGGTVSDFVIDPANPSKIYAAVEGSGIEESSNSGQSWTTLNTGIPSGTNLQNTALAIAASAPTTLFAAVAGNTSFASIYKTTDGGARWHRVLNLSSQDYMSDGYAYGSGSGDQSWYDNTLAVSPSNPNIVVAGGITALESRNGGTSWTNLNGGSINTGGTNCFHPDFHALAFDPSGNLYIGNDGGAWQITAAGVSNPVSASSNSCQDYVDLNAELNITQFYPGASETTDGAQVLAGSQDNGTLSYNGSQSWSQVLGGDGGATDTYNGQVQYGEEDQSLQFTSDGWSHSSDITPSTGQKPWVPPLLMIPGNDAPTILFGADHVYRSTNGGLQAPFCFFFGCSPLCPNPLGCSTWSKTNSYGNSEVSALAVAPTDSQIVYAGYQDGTIQVSTDGGNKWTTLPSISPNGFWVTHIAVDSSDPGTIYVSLADGLVPTTPTTPRVVEGTGMQGSGTWTDLTGDLPNTVPTNSVTVAGSGLVVGTDVGVFYASTLNGSSTLWTPVGSGLPNSQIMDVIFTGNGTLLVTTHGRGAWTIPFSATTPITSGDLIVSDAGADTVSEYTPGGTFVQTLIDSSDGLSLPAGSAFDQSGDLFVTDFAGDQIFKVDAATGTVSAFSNDSILNDGHVFNSPESIAFSPDFSKMYVSDANREGTGGGVNVINPKTGSGEGFLPLPSSVGSEGIGESDWLAFDSSGTLYMSNENPSQGVMKVDLSTGDIETPGFATNLPNYGYGVSFGQNGNVWVADTDSVLEYDSTGKLIQRIFNSAFNTVFAATFDPSGQTFYAGDLATGEVYIYGTDGTPKGVFEAGLEVSGLAVAHGAVLPPAPSGSGLLSILATILGELTQGSSVIAGSPGNTLNFTYTPAPGGLRNGHLQVTIPDGWSPPTTADAPGKVTASTGTVTTSGQTIDVTGITAAGSSPVTITYGVGGGATGAVAPATPGTSNFTIAEASDPAETLTKLPGQYSVVVTAPPLDISPASIPSASVGLSYSSQLTASGGSAPYSWTLADGALPPGISLDSATGLLSGTPTTPGTYTFLVEVTDSTSPNIRASEETLSLVVSPEPSPDDLFTQLLEQVQGVGPGTSLADKVQAGKAYYDANDVANTCGDMNAFISEVNAQTGRSISPAAAETLVADAQRIENVISCP